MFCENCCKYLSFAIFLWHISVFLYSSTGFVHPLFNCVSFYCFSVYKHYLCDAFFLPYEKYKIAKAHYFFPSEVYLH